MKKADPNPKANRNIMKLVYAVVALFLGMMAYMGYFLQAESEDVINNAYNPRLDSFADRVVRGEILASDGTVLAVTQVDSDGNEVRVYPFGSLYDHVVGYSSRGKTGIESLANFYLLSSHVNLAEQIVNQLKGVKNPGDHVYTTLDPQLQQAASDALGDRRGAVIAMEPDTGKILAMVSKPGYDPNTLEADWEALASGDSQEGRLLNRAFQGLYPPGSTFKIVTALEYMREHPEDYKNYQFDCDGVYENGEYQIRCYHSTAHGSQDFLHSFANSCNGAFANLGLSLDLDGFARTAKGVLFNRDLATLQPQFLCSGTGSGNLGDSSDIDGPGGYTDHADPQCDDYSCYCKWRDPDEALSFGPSGKWRRRRNQEVPAGSLWRSDDGWGSC